ncbi:MAG: serine/threonine-protein kinase PknK [Spirulina sp. SIO3F2]|nr:serine/threonine-protein kinase PknK [Spirulina sp. SIO3F2]
MILFDSPTISNYQASTLIHESDRTLVYRGQNIKNGQPVIIKLMGHEYPSFNELVQFRNQYAIARNLNIEGIVKPIALERYEDRYALIMEDFGGVALSVTSSQRCDPSESNSPRERASKSVISEEAEIRDTIARFLDIAIQLAEILHQLHQNHIIHKDIKPANILIHPETQQVKLIDFSIATVLPKETQTIQTPNVLEGTLPYLSPEQTGRMNRGIDYRSDFYGLGVTFYELLTGKLPFESEDPLELVHAHIAKIPPAIVTTLDKGGRENQVPTALAEIVMKLMAKNAEDRYQSSLGLKYDLEKCQQQWQETGKIEPFELGERDICDRFVLSEKLYGREQEVQILLNAFERVANPSQNPDPPPSRLPKGGEPNTQHPTPNSELILVAGFSGIGKTAVINEVQKPIVRQHGYFIKGKFDQFQRNIPFSAFVQAFRDLMGQLLGESDRQLQQWKGEILQALGEQAQVIIDVIPELEQIIGQQPPVSELSGSATQNRFNQLFGQFIQVFATPQHPLVIFIDDLQWVDAASLKLIQLLMGDTRQDYLLLLGAYRDNEVSPSHPLMLAIAEIEKSGAAIATITLNPLSKQDLNCLTADSLSCDQSVVQPLTELIYGKTQGNPFFSTQFLKGLYEDGWIVFIPPQSPLTKGGNKGGWQCDLTKVRELALSDDVIEFMAGRLHKLPPETCNVLKLAACLSNQFELDALATASDRPLEETAAALWPALQEGFILPVSETYKFFQETIPVVREVFTDVAVGYQFLHDRVQQAAYSLILDDQKEATHYHIGQKLLARLSPREQEERIFDIVNQLNIGQRLLVEDNATQKLAELNLKAGHKAKASTAYEAANNYFKSGLNLLETHHWDSLYELIFDLHLNLAETELMTVDFESLEKTLSTALEFAKSAVDRAKVYGIKVNQYCRCGAYNQAIESGLEGLEGLGIAVNREHLNVLVQQEFANIDTILADRPVATLIDLPQNDCLETQAIIDLLTNLIPATYIISDIEMYSFVSVMTTRLSIEQGNVPRSTFGYVNYGFLLCLISWGKFPAALRR